MAVQKPPSQSAAATHRLTGDADTPGSAEIAAIAPSQRARPGSPLCVLRAEALEHLPAIVQRVAPPKRELLHEEFILREDFKNWVEEKGIALPILWFGARSSHGLLPGARADWPPAAPGLTDLAFGVNGTDLAAFGNQGHNRVMKIAIELNQAQTERLQTIAASLGVDAQELAQAAVADFVSTSADDFETAASRVLTKNRELYQRLA